MRHKNRLILYLAISFILYASFTILLQAFDERRWKTSVFQSKLENYADIINSIDTIVDINQIISDNIRVTILNFSGDVVYDSFGSVSDMTNHQLRPEVVKCLSNGVGYSIRESETLQKKYFYFAKKYDDRVIRIAQDYHTDVERFFRFDWVMLVAMISLFLLVLILVIFFARRYEHKEMVKAEEDAKRLKHEMTGNISHELKTPVSSIMGYLETIISHPELTQEKRQMFLERSHSQAVRLSDMIRDISLITKLEESPSQFKITPVNIRHLVEDIMDEMRQSIIASDLSVQNNLPPICIKANDGLLHAIFRNLLENSIKYGGSGCSVTIDYHYLGEGKHQFKYKDNGRGVPASEQNKIFGRFYRLDADRNNDGSGLGLSIVRNAVLFHYGEIEAFTPDEGGLGFKFTIDSYLLERKSAAIIKDLF